MKIKSILILIPILTLLTGCDIKQYFFNPSRIEGMPSISESSIKWGGEQAKITANITRVVIECIPVERKEGGGIFSGKANKEYEIAVTALINYNVIDNNFFKRVTMYSNLEANIIFEAVTNSGVVLGQSKSTVRLIENSSRATTSAKIVGLSFDEISRVKTVYAKWEYGI